MFDSLLDTIAGGVNLSDEQVAFVTSLWRPRELRKGECFQRAGEVTTHGAFVVRGCFRTYAIDADGAETILHSSAAGQILHDKSCVRAPGPRRGQALDGMPSLPVHPRSRRACHVRRRGGLEQRDPTHSGLSWRVRYGPVPVRFGLFEPGGWKFVEGLNPCPSK
jgi:CRP-like cAMP-binding protein